MPSESVEAFYTRSVERSTLLELRRHSTDLLSHPFFNPDYVRAGLFHGRNPSWFAFRLDLRPDLIDDLACTPAAIAWADETNGTPLGYLKHLRATAVDQDQWTRGHTHLAFATIYAGKACHQALAHLLSAAQSHPTYVDHLCHTPLGPEPSLNREDPEFQLALDFGIVASWSNCPTCNLRIPKTPFNVDRDGVAVCSSCRAVDHANNHILNW